MQIKLQGTEIGIFSDPHYGIHRNSEVWHNIAYEHAKWVKSEFTTRGIKDIIIPGDIFHDRNDVAVNTLQVASSIFKLLEGFNIIITVGNHDAFYRDNSEVHSTSILKGWKNITVVDKLTELVVYGKSVYLCPWGQNVNEIPECDIIFGHFEINTFKMNSFKVCTNGVKPSELLGKAKLIISGHFHHKEEREYAKGKIVYVGCPYHQDWGDYQTTKGLYILDVIDSKLIFIENDISPKYLKILYTEACNNVDINLIKNNIIKLMVDKMDTPENVDKIVRKIASCKPTELTIEYVVNEQSKINAEEMYSKEFDINVEKSIEEFIDLMNVTNKDKIKDYVKTLYIKAQTV